jgi:hypothetical protein
MSLSSSRFYLSFVNSHGIGSKPQMVILLHSLYDPFIRNIIKHVLLHNSGSTYVPTTVDPNQSILARLVDSFHPPTAKVMLIRNFYGSGLIHE